MSALQSCFTGTIYSLCLDFKTEDNSQKGSLKLWILFKEKNQQRFKYDYGMNIFIYLWGFTLKPYHPALIQALDFYSAVWLSACEPF